MEPRENSPVALPVLLRNLCFVGLAALFLVHFLMTLAFTLPPTPLTVEYGRAIDNWMIPYFTQSWGFFAPNHRRKTISLSLNIGISRPPER